MKSTRLSGCALAATMLVASAAYAGPTDVTFCRSEVVAMAKYRGSASLGDKTIFTCDNAIKSTIPALYKSGWRVIQMHPSMAENPEQASTFTLILIEKD